MESVQSGCLAMEKVGIKGKASHTRREEGKGGTMSVYFVAFVRLVFIPPEKGESSGSFARFVRQGIASNSMTRGVCWASCTRYISRTLAFTADQVSRL